MIKALPLPKPFQVRYLRRQSLLSEVNPHTWKRSRFHPETINGSFVSRLHSDHEHSCVLFVETSGDSSFLQIMTGEKSTRMTCLTNVIRGIHQPTNDATNKRRCIYVAGVVLRNRPCHHWIVIDQEICTK